MIDIEFSLLCPREHHHDLLHEAQRGMTFWMQKHRQQYNDRDPSKMSELSR